MILRLGLIIVAFLMSLSHATAAQMTNAMASTVFRERCAGCHGPTGDPNDVTPLTRVQPYDFSKCSVASAEPDAAWIVAVRDGGPAVGLSSEMPAFGKELNEEQIRAVVEYLRSLCLDKGWPNGNLNLPRPIFTEKAFPEDEVVVLPAISHRRGVPDDAQSAVIVEKRFGQRNNVEIEFPFASVDSGAGRERGFGDLELAVKRVVFADRAGTRILSCGLETAFPTGNASKGLGEGTTRFESFVAAAMAFGRASLQTKLGLELPKSNPWENRAFEYGAYAGYDVTVDPKRWTVGIELTGENKELAVTPQVRKALVKTNALAAAIGMQIPVTERSEQDLRIVGYLLWDYREPVLRRR